jgi:shikimate kinase
MLAPLSKKNDTKIEIIGELTSKPYIDITIELLKKFGIEIENNDYKNFYIKANQKYKSINLDIEIDWSSANYFLSLACISDSEITINKNPNNSIQGDAKFYKILEKMGAKIILKENSISLKGTKNLKDIGTINMNDMPDSAVTLAVISSLLKGETIITGIENLKIKECNRIEAIKKELNKCGIKSEELDDGIKIQGGKIKKAKIETYDDHRIAMSFALLQKINPEIEILNKECVNKSFPDFFEELNKINFKNIVLIGMRGSGKTTIGKLLAKKLNKDFIDTDNYIEKKERKKISKIVDEKGWDYFREKEKKCIEEISKSGNSIISTGGGVVLNEENIKNLKRNGIIVFIKTPIKILLKRINNITERPSLTGKAMEEELKDIWEKRKDKYMKYTDIIYEKNDVRLDKFDAIAIIELISNFQFPIFN